MKAQMPLPLSRLTLYMDQLNEAVKKKDKSSIQDIINSGDTWVVK